MDNELMLMLMLMIMMIMMASQVDAYLDFSILAVLQNYRSPSIFASQGETYEPEKQETDRES
jgi:hypothetical protein